jgi:hypothetical protein
MRKIPAVSAALLLLLGLVLLLPASAAATPSYCAITWGSQAKSAPHLSAGPLVGVRSGRHQCFDRLVVDIDGAAPGFSVAYVPQVAQDGSGFPVHLRGGAFLQVVVRSPAYTWQGHSTYSPANRSELVNVWGYDTFRQVAWAGSFEGQSTIGLGVRARLPFRVFTLQAPSRLVVDVAHYW